MSPSLDPSSPFQALVFARLKSVVVAERMIGVAMFELVDAWLKVGSRWTLRVGRRSDSNR